MSDDIRFLGDFVRALSGARVDTALRGVLRRTGPGASREHRQLLRFMALVKRHRDRGLGEDLAEWITERRDRLDVLVEKDGQVFATRTLDPERPGVVVEGVLPGEYLVKLDTGQRVWQGTVAAADVLVSGSYPIRPIKLAAATEGESGTPTRTVDCPHVRLAISLYAGFESGAIMIGEMK